MALSTKSSLEKKCKDDFAPLSLEFPKSCLGDCSAIVCAKQKLSGAPVATVLTFNVVLAENLFLLKPLDPFGTEKKKITDLQIIYTVYRR